MQDLFRETVFGRIAHLVSGGKLFSTNEQRNPALLQRYLATELTSTAATSRTAISRSATTSHSNLKEDGDLQRLNVLNSAATSRVSVRGDSDALANNKVDAEKGSDFQLVDWSENDREV